MLIMVNLALDIHFNLCPFFSFTKNSNLFQCANRKFNLLLP